MGENDADIVPNEFACDLGEPIRASFSPAIFYYDVAAFCPAELSQSLHEGSGPAALRFRSVGAQQSYHARRLLGTYSERPCGCRTSKQCDEFAPSHGRPQGT
jgi:hypothetical protein